jgi:hypothetical protein
MLFFKTLHNNSINSLTMFAPVMKSYVQSRSILKNLSELYKGFLWGLGFAIATGIAYVIITMHLSASIAHNYNKEMRSFITTEFNTASKLFQAEVINTVVKNDHVHLAVKYENIFDAAFAGSGYKMSFTLFDTSKNFMGNCEADIQNYHSEESHIYSEVACPSTFSDANSFGHATVSIVINDRT